MNDVLIVGVGGAGSHLASYLQTALGNPAVVINTDKKSLEKSALTWRVLIGPKTCGGYGANVPARGRRAAEESSEDLESILKGTRKLVLVAGFGGGTGTGAVPVIAKLARDRGMDVIAAVTLPFEVEDVRRKHALNGLRELKETGATVLIHNHAANFQEAEPMLCILESAAKALGEAVKHHLARSDSVRV